MIHRLHLHLFRSLQLGLASALLVILPLASPASTSMFAGFHGADRIQFQYSFSDPEYDVVDYYVLWRYAPGGSRTQVASGNPIAGIDHPIGLAPGDYRYELEVHPTGGGISVGTLWTASLPNFSGTAILTETYSSLDSALGSIIIPEGVSITMSVVTNLSLSANIGGTLNLSEATGSLGAVGGGHLNIHYCTVPTGGAWDVSGNLQSVISRCIMEGPLYVTGPNHTLEDNTIYGRLFLRESAATIRNNIFLSDICLQRDLYGGAHSLTPDIRDNSFLGRRAIGFEDWNGHPIYFDTTVGLPVPIGKNYYGDALGPVREGEPEFIEYSSSPVFSPYFLKRGGARVIDGGGAWLTLDGFHPTGQKNKNKSVFPDIWCNGLTVVQNTVDHSASFINMASFSPLRANRETLVSVDVRAWDDDINGIKVYAEVNGQTYLAESGKTIRDITDPKMNGSVKHGNTTFNIILPPLSVTGTTLRVYMDTTGVSGYGNPDGKTNLLYQTYDGWFGFAPYRERPLRIMVAPWEIWCPAYPRGVPDASHSVDSLRRLIPAMLPYGVGHFEVIQESAGRYEAGYGGLAEIFSSTVLTDRLLLDLSLFLNEYNARAPEPVDRLVVIVKKGVLGTAQDMAAVGVNNKWIDSRICVVEEDTPNGPDSALHELGHSLGLYTGLSGEQYGRWHYPPDGLALKSYTAFSPQPGYVAHQTRIRHMTQWMPADTWYDVMGRGNPFWISETSLQSFWTFDSGLGAPVITAAGTSRGLSIAEAPASGPGPGMRRVLLRGMVDTNLLLVGGTVRGFDVTSESRTPLPPNPHLSNREYEFEAFDAGGAVLTNTLFILDTYHPSQTNAIVGGTPWQATFDIPGTATRCELRREFITNVVWSATSSGSLNCTITSPSAPGPLSNLVELVWNTTHNGAFPPLYRVMASTNHGLSWANTGGLLDTNRWAVPPDFLRPGVQLGFKVVVSDGMKTASTSMTPFSLADRSPSLRIRYPQDGDRGLVSNAWALVAEATDHEDGVITAGQWTSSLAGVLGSGSALSPVMLSTGTHVLAFTTWDTGGHSVTASVLVVVVTNFTTVDLSLGEDALTILAPDSDPAYSLAPHLQSGATNYLAIAVRNEGWTNTTALLSLYLQPPGSTEFLLTSQQVTMAEFETADIGSFYVPPTSGLYRVRSVISGVAPTDATPSNNERIWWASADLGTVHVTLDPPEAIASGAQWALDGGGWVNGGTAISNVQAGAHMISFKPITGYHTPASRTAEVSAARTFSYCRQYEPYHASLQVGLLPARAASEGAAYRVDGGAWYASGEIVSNLEPGVRSVEFKPAAWWSTPPGFGVTVVDNELTVTNATYGALPRPPDPAIVYYPTNGQGNVQVAYASLQWYLAPSTTTYRVWCGTNSSLGASAFQGEFAGYEGFNSYEPSLGYDKQYYWRIDSLNSYGVTTGTVWAFHTQGQVPVLVSASQVTGEIGSLFTYQPRWTFADTNWAEDVPAWVTTGSGGRMEGWPTASGVSYVYLYATNANGTTLGVCEFNIQGGPVLTWQQAASPTNARLLSVAWGDDTYVAVGEKGVALTSSNGLNWVVRSTGRTNHFNGITYGSGRFVAVGEAGSVIVSTNRGSTWNYYASGYTAPFNGVGYGNGLFVAVGYEKNIYTSANGQTWTVRNTGFYQPLATAARSSNTWLAVGGLGWGEPTALISSNGTTWTAVDPGVGFNGFFSTCWNSSYFSAVGKGGRIMTTTNGTAWKNHTTFTSADLMAVAASGDHCAVAGGGGCLALSRNGSDWAVQATGVSADLRGITFGDCRVVAVGDLGTIVTATYEPDTDCDAMPDWAERIAGTGLTNPASFLGISTVSQANGKPVIRWQGVTGHVYRLERTGQLTGAPAFTGIATNISGVMPITTYTDTTTGVSGPWFYRVKTP